MKKFFLLVLLVCSPVFAESPSIALPDVPTLPLTVVFKNITRQDQFQLVVQTLKQSKRVDPFVMKRAQRGLIEYEGRFFGESSTLMDALQQAVQEKFKVESKPKGDGLEILVTPQTS
ncbi:MAG: hypothetical protein Q7T03_10865 [Deltaproteobacteria bacterium]|nr:hypothetical protein [Deltaproteobacteria bacterium]